MKFLIFSTFLFALVLTVSGQQRKIETNDAHAPIVKQLYDLGSDGSYQWHYETANGIAAQEQGALKYAGQKEEALEVKGHAGWTGADGVHYEISYIADENGFQPQGAHLPTPPPVPEAILRALKFIQEHPEQPEKVHQQGPSRYSGK